MSKTTEISKITQERIENVFDEFVVNKIITELDPIKKDFKRSDHSYADKTTREFIENIHRSVSDIEYSVDKMKKSIIHQDPSWKMSEQIQYVVDSQSDISDNIESINDNLSVLKEEVSTQLSAHSDDIDKSIENAVNTLSAQNEQETKNTVEQLQKLCENIQTLSGDFTKELNSFDVSNQEKINNIFDSVAKKIDDLNLAQGQAINEQSKALNERFDKTDSVFEKFSDTTNQNALLIKDEISKTADTVIQSIGCGVASFENTSAQNVSELKAHICDVMAEYEAKMTAINASNMKNTNLMLKILIGISALNVGGIITAIILSLIF